MKGSVRQRGNSYTTYWFTTDPATGKRRQHSKGGFLHKEPARRSGGQMPKGRMEGDSAREYLNSIIGKVQAGDYKPDQKMTVAQLLTEYFIPARASKGLRPATVSLYRNAAQAWVIPHLGSVDVRKLSPAAVEEMVTKLRTAGSRLGRGGLSPRSVQLAVTVLKAATSWALKTGLLNRDPLAGYDRPRATSRSMTSWTVPEARAFLAATRQDRLGFAWALLLTRGLRRGELCGLKWEDVDLQAGVARINRTRVLVDGQPVESTPKTAAGRRALPLDSMLVDLLKAHRARQATEKLAAGSAYEDGGWLVADELGRPLYPDTVSERFAQLVRSTGARPIRTHDTRHTAASLMLASGVPVKVVADLLGHDPKVTLATYAHVIPGMGEQAGAALSAALLG